MIRKAEIKDLTSAMEIINDAKDLLKKSGSTQWNLIDGYPDITTIKSDIEKEILYVYEENHQIGVVYTPYLCVL